MTTRLAMLTSTLAASLLGLAAGGAQAQGTGPAVAQAPQAASIPAVHRPVQMKAREHLLLAMTHISAGRARQALDGVERAHTILLNQTAQMMGAEFTTHPLAPTRALAQLERLRGALMQPDIATAWQHAMAAAEAIDAELGPMA